MGPVGLILIPMVGVTDEDGVGAVELFEGDDEG